MGESFADQVRRDHADVIAAAEQRAADAVALGVENLRVAIEREAWPWDRQVLEGHLRRIEDQSDAAADVDGDVDGGVLGSADPHPDVAV